MEGSVPLDNLHHKKGHPAYSHLEAPEGIFTHHPFAPKCLFILNVILLALTAQVFRAYIFADPVIYPLPVPETPDCSGVNKTVCQGGQIANATKCMFAPANDGDACGTGRFCSFGNCLLPSDPAFGKTCDSPKDLRCVFQSTGTLEDGECQYETRPNGFQCESVSGESEQEKTYRGWACTNAVCTSPTRIHVANQAYQWSITTGLVGAAVAIEFIITGDVSVELALLAMNVGLILIGWDGFLQDLGLEVNNGLGRTQLAFGLVCGGFATLFATYTVLSKLQKKQETQHVIFAAMLIFTHGITIGLVARAYNETFNHFERRDIIDQFSIVASFAFPASLFAAAVAIAVSLSLLLTGTFSAGFGALTFVTGVIEIGWASTQYNEGVNNRDSVDGREFTGTVKAWLSWAVIAGFFSIVVGLILAYRDSKETKPQRDRSGPSPKVSGGLALLLVLVFYTTIGLTASLFQKYFFERNWSVFGNNMRIVGGDNFGNQMSGFAWEDSIWAAAVASSFGIAVLKGGVSGIAALTITFSANLIGWAAAHHAIGSVVGDSNELRGRSRAWEALCLVSGVCAFFIAAVVLKSHNPDNNTRKVSSTPAATPEGQ